MRRGQRKGHDDRGLNLSVLTGSVAQVRRGRYMRGNRPSLGWQYVPTQFDANGRPVEFKLVHDPETFPIRQRILALYQQGLSFRQIATLLTDEGVPTSRQLARQQGSKGVWYAQVVRNIIESPLNVGTATSIRQRAEKAPPDGRHSHTWRRQMRLPHEQQIVLPQGTVEPIITAEQAAQIARRTEHNKRQRTTQEHWARRGILSGGLATCGICGRNLHFRVVKYPNPVNGMGLLCSTG